MRSLFEHGDQAFLLSVLGKEHSQKVKKNQRSTTFISEESLIDNHYPWFSLVLGEFITAASDIYRVFAGG